jgi:hypothetical protein
VAHPAVTSLLLHGFERVDDFVCEAEKDLRFNFFLAAAKHSSWTRLLPVNAAIG